MGHRVMVAVVTIAFVVVGAAPAGAAAGATSLKWTDGSTTVMQGTAVGPDGSVVVVGEKLVKSKTKAVVTSYAPDGTRTWQSSWAPEGRAFASGVAVDVGDDGTIAWVGRVHSVHCEGGGWFLEVRRSDGELVQRYISPGWQCEIAEAITDVAVAPDQIVIAGFDHGCCDDPYEDGWVQAFTLDATPTWTTAFEPPEGTPVEYFDRVTGIAIGNDGEVFAAGWAASETIESGYKWHGSLVVQKMTSGGGVLWRQSVLDGRYSWDTTAKVAVRDQMVMVLGATRPGPITWGAQGPANGWLARLTPDGSVAWTRSWGQEWSDAAKAQDLSIDGQSNTWIVGTSRDPDDRGYNLFVRRYGPVGGLNWALKHADMPPFTYGTGVAAIGKSGAAVTGFETEERKGEAVRGHVWVFGPGAST